MIFSIDNTPSGSRVLKATQLESPEKAEYFTFVIFPRYTWGKKKGEVNKSAPIEVTILGEEKYSEGGKHTPAFVDAIRRLREYGAERDDKGRKIGSDIAFHLVKRETPAVATPVLEEVA